MVTFGHQRLVVSSCVALCKGDPYLGRLIDTLDERLYLCVQVVGDTVIQISGLITRNFYGITIQLLIFHFIFMIIRQQLIDEQVC